MLKLRSLIKHDLDHLHSHQNVFWPIPNKKPITNYRLFNLDYALEFVIACPEAFGEELKMQENQAFWIPITIGRKVK